MKKIISLCICLFAGSANAGLIEFVPPNDTTGGVLSTNINDGWATGRGLVFQMLDDVSIDSVGLFQDLTSINLSFELSQVTSASGIVTNGQTVLTSGSSVVNTSGLEWVDFDIADLLLEAGNFYHLEFTFFGISNQNFFYNNENIAFSQGNFDLLEGTLGGDTGNFVMGAFRLNEVDSVSVSVPEPASIALLGLGLAGIGFSRKKKTA